MDPCACVVFEAPRIPGVRDGHGVLHGGYIALRHPSTVLICDPCPFGLPEKLTRAHMWSEFRHPTSGVLVVAMLENGAYIQDRLLGLVIP